MAHRNPLHDEKMMIKDFFRSDLTEARNRLHEAFSGIYGYNYKVNHAFFFQFFNDLEAYMAGRRGDLGQLVTSFFAQLRTSIVVLMEKAEGTASGGMNSAPATGGDAPPDTQRINCLSEALGKQNAFDLTDVHLKEQFLQVYPPARMLVNSLAATAKLLRTVVEDGKRDEACELFRGTESVRFGIQTVPLTLRLATLRVRKFMDCCVNWFHTTEGFSIRVMFTDGRQYGSFKKIQDD
ncbi:hypothetical protein ACTXT7_005491 [Hymenolepis weldensis]